MLTLVNPDEGYYEWKPSNCFKRTVGQFVMKDCGTHMELWNLGLWERNDRNKGYGQMLVREAVEVANGKKLKLYVKCDNDVAIHVYKKCGFEITDTYGADGYAWEMTYVGNAAEDTIEKVTCGM